MVHTDSGGRFVLEIIMDFRVISCYILNGRTSSNPVQYDPWVLILPQNQRAYLLQNLSLLIPDVRANVGPSMRESVSLALGIPSPAEQTKNECMHACLNEQKGRKWFASPSP